MLKTPIDTIREKLSGLKTQDMFLPERCRSMEEIVFDMLNEIEIVQKKIEKIHKVLGE